MVSSIPINTNNVYTITLFCLFLSNTNNLQVVYNHFKLADTSYLDTL